MEIAIFDPAGVVTFGIFYPGFQPGLIISDPLRGQLHWN